MSEPNLLPLITAYWKSMAIYVAAKLGLADLVKDGPRSAADLAAATGTHAPSLRRVLRALASEGIFAEDAAGNFGLTPLASRLLSDSPLSQRSVALMMGEEHYRAWGELLHSVRTGETAFQHVFGQPVFEYLATHPTSARLFDEAMTGIHGAETPAMLAAYDFSGIGTLVDVGGGNGSMLAAILKRHPALRGILYDRDHVIERARQRLAAEGLTDRCQAVAGDFFKGVPAGGDAYILRHIIHDWYDEQSLTILRHIRQVIPAGGKLLLVEKLVPPGNDPAWVKWLDLTMLTLPGGMERTEEEYRGLLDRAGFRLQRVVPTAEQVDVLEAVPAG